MKTQVTTKETMSTEEEVKGQLQNLFNRIANNPGEALQTLVKTTIPQQQIKDSLNRKWYTTWDIVERTYASHQFINKHADFVAPKIAGKIMYFRDQPSGFIGIPAWVEQFVWWIKTQPEFPYEILFNIYDTGNKILLPPKGDLDPFYMQEVTMMGYIVETWLPNVNRSLFSTSQFDELEALMKNKNTITLSERVFGGVVGRDVGNTIIPKIINPKIAPQGDEILPSDQTLKYLKYGAYAVGGLVILGSAGYAANEIKNVIK